MIPFRTGSVHFLVLMKPAAKNKFPAVNPQKLEHGIRVLGGRIHYTVGDLGIMMFQLSGLYFKPYLSPTEEAVGTWTLSSSMVDPIKTLYTTLKGILKGIAQGVHGALGNVF